MLLAVGVASSWASDWHKVRGNERAVIVYPLGSGEKVWLEAEVEGRESPLVVPLEVGPTLIKPEAGWLCYRVVKLSDEFAEKMPTTIELVIANGKALPRARNADDTKRAD